VLCVAPVTTPATVHAQAPHAYALVGGGGSAVEFVDLASRQQMPSGEKVAWLLVVNDPATQKISHSLIQYQIDCRGWQGRVRYGASYAANGATLGSGVVHRAPTPIVRHSLGDVVANYLCKGVDPFPRVPRIADTGLAVASAQSLIAEEKKDAPRPKTPRVNAKVASDGAI
jgi:hypothetical protein